jgi:hypothetical protein
LPHHHLYRHGDAVAVEVDSYDLKIGRHGLSGSQALKISKKRVGQGKTRAGADRRSCSCQTAPS